jgi:hypothetical protein
MPVVRVGMVRVVVNHRFVPVGVRVGLRWRSLAVRVIVVLITDVGVIVFRGIVHVPVPMARPDEDGNAGRHDQAGNDLLPR